MPFTSSHRLFAILTTILFLVVGSFVWSPTFFSLMGDEKPSLPVRPDLEAALLSGLGHRVEPVHLPNGSIDLGPSLDEAISGAMRSASDDRIDQQLDELLESASSFDMAEPQLMARALSQDEGLFDGSEYQTLVCDLCNVGDGSRGSRAHGGDGMAVGGGLISIGGAPSSVGSGGGSGAGHSGSAPSENEHGAVDRGGSAGGSIAGGSSSSSSGFGVGSATREKPGAASEPGTTAPGPGAVNGEEVPIADAGETPRLTFKLDKDTHEVTPSLVIPDGPFDDGPLADGSIGSEELFPGSRPESGLSAPESPAPVPEPATLTLTGLGIAALIARNRRARHKQAE